MSRICELHDEAMDIMNKAIELESEGRNEEALNLFLRACDLESESAYLVEKNEVNEPSRGMLFLGAASLAWRGKEYQRAERLVCEGLSGFPTEKTKQDLRQLHDEIKFKIIAEETAQDLKEAETEIRFFGGEGVGYGRILARALMQKVDALEKMVARTIQRKSGLPFENHPKKHIALPSYQLNVEWAPAGSFGMRVRLTQKLAEPISLIAPTPQEILDEVVNNIQIVSTGNEEDLRKKIEDEEYCAHFVSQAKEMLPDGKTVKNVGFIGSKKSFTTSKTKKELSAEIEKSDDASLHSKKKTPEIHTYKGWLRLSDGFKNRFVLSTEGDEKPIQIHVRDALEELAKKYFGDLVEIKCEKRGTKYYLKDITSLQ